MGLLDKIIGAVTKRPDAATGLTAAQSKQLGEALAPMDIVQPDLAAQALAFVEQAENVGLLQSLSTLPKAKDFSDLLGKPGRLRWQFNAWNNKPVENAGKKSLTARSAFYASIEADKPPLDALVRLGKILAAADNGSSLEPTGAPGPQWLHYLLNDAWFSSFNEKMSTAEAS